MEKTLDVCPRTFVRHFSFLFSFSTLHATSVKVNNHEGPSHPPRYPLCFLFSFRSIGCTDANKVRVTFYS
jgi:hypothetical protein